MSFSNARVRNDFKEPLQAQILILLSLTCLYSEHSDGFHIYAQELDFCNFSENCKLFFSLFGCLGVKVVGAQELDKRWKISTETAIKAKSMRGYATYTR